MNKQIVDAVKNKTFALRTVAVYDTRYLELFEKLNADDLCNRMMSDILFINEESVSRFNEIVENFEKLSARERANLRIE